MIPPLIVRADASLGIGLGHLVRSLALANAWQDLGGRVVLATATTPEQFPASAPADGIEITRIAQPYPDPADLATVEQVLDRNPGAWVTCDGYGFDAEYTRHIDRTGARVVVIDDQAHQPVYHTHVLVNQNLGAEKLEYRFDREPICLLGPRFALLGRSYSSWRHWSRSIPERAATLLVSLGGGNATPVLATVLRTCVRLAVGPLRVVIVTGPQADLGSWAALEAWGTKGLSFERAANPADMPGLMAWADLAVTAAGSTVWQLCFMGVPALVLTLVDNQSGIASHLEEFGCAVNLGWHAGLDEEHLRAVLERLLRDKAARAAMSARGRALVDGRGAERIAAAMLAVNAA